MLQYVRDVSESRERCNEIWVFDSWQYNLSDCHDVHVGVNAFIFWSFTWTNCKFDGISFFIELQDFLELCQKKEWCVVVICVRLLHKLFMQSWILFCFHFRLILCILLVWKPGYYTLLTRQLSILNTENEYLYMRKKNPETKKKFYATQYEKNYFYLNTNPSILKKY